MYIVLLLSTFIIFDSTQVFIKPLVRLFISYFVILMSFEAVVKL